MVDDEAGNAAQVQEAGDAYSDGKSRIRLPKFRTSHAAAAGKPPVTLAATRKGGGGPSRAISGPS